MSLTVLGSCQPKSSNYEHSLVCPPSWVFLPDLHPKLTRARVNISSAVCNPLLRLAYLRQKAIHRTRLHKHYSPHTLFLLTQGYDGVRSNHRRHDRASNLGDWLRGWSFIATLRRCYYRERKKTHIYSTSGANPALRWHVQRIILSALQWSASAEEARMDWIRRKARFSTLAGQSWAIFPKVKIYFTCKENWFCSKNKAKEKLTLDRLRTHQWSMFFVPSI